MEVEELDEHLQKVLKDTSLRSVVDKIDAIIVFEKGKWKGTVKGSQVHQTKQTQLSSFFGVLDAKYLRNV